ncbi:hypothetical protein NQ314_019238 [Rhamnusium bicolor]|uniref:Uncharacterized protein n=1 Tax=Rhamnusium bicolor TaxID=1586634 RepID=A0AAV8WPU1_9CUCU|nr:hypothetical protein NQ314_019238 [Rhamnusium bicolor]
MVDVFTDKTLSYRNLLEESCNLAEALRTYGYSTNTILSICSENSLKFFIPVLASLFVGSTMAPLNHNYTQLELKHTLNISKPKVVFCSEATSSKFINLKKELEYIEAVVIIDSNREIFEAETLKEFVSKALKGNYVLPYKFQPFIGDTSSLGAFIMCSSDRRYQDEDGVTLGLMPFFHAYGLIVSLTSIIYKRKIIVLREFEEDRFLKAIQDHKISLLSLAPPLAIFFGKDPEVIKLRFILFTFSRLKNVSIRQGYGLTEATLAVTKMDKMSARPGSSGKVAPYMSCKVRDPETGKSLGPNQVGELCFKGPMIMMGYYNNEKATRESFTSDGWLKTGDLGYYDNEGFVYIVDRLKELIKYKGFQVAPAELEAILVNHPKVRDVGVVGLPDDLSGELPLAFVVKHEGVNVTEKRTSGLCC